MATDQYHSRALAHYGGECQKCGMTNEEHNDEHGRNLDVHHKDADSSHNNLENLAVLCRACHRKSHYGKEGYRDLYEQLPMDARWEDSESEWKTLRVKELAWEEAKGQKEEAGRTWSEQIVRGEDAGGLDAEALEQAIDQICMANTPGVEIDTEEVLSEVGKAVELAEQARDNTEQLKEQMR